MGSGPTRVSAARRTTPSLRDLDDGTYECHWEATVSGVYSVGVTLRGVHIAGSPFTARVIAPGADPEHCRLRGASPITVVAGETASFGLEFYDCLGGSAPLEPLDVYGVLRHVDARADPVKGGTLSPTKRADGSALSNLEVALNAGSFGEGEQEDCVVSFSVEQSGDYLLHVRFARRQRPFPGSPIPLKVLPAKANAMTSRLVIEPAQLTSPAGESKALRLLTFDEFGKTAAAARM